MCVFTYTYTVHTHVNKLLFWIWLIVINCLTALKIIHTLQTFWGSVRYFLFRKGELNPLNWSEVTINRFIMLQNIYFSIKCCSFELSAHQRILKITNSPFQQGLVHPKMKISPCFTRPQGIGVYDFLLSDESHRSYIENCPALQALVWE